MTLGKWLNQIESKLRTVGIDSARLDALILLETATGWDRAKILAQSDTLLHPKILKKLKLSLSRRLQREPLAYITGLKEFYGLPFKVTPDVLIPRPETETMVEYAIKRAPNAAKVLEIGTGSGAVAVALKFNRTDLNLTATDISDKALNMAKANAKKHKVKITFIKNDLLAQLQNFQLILANLPYLPRGTRSEPELSFEPKIALFAGKDGLDYYRRLLAELNDHLAPRGWALIEASPTQRRALFTMAKSHGFKLVPVTEYIYRLTG